SGVFTVTLNDNISVSGMRFEDGTVTIAPGAISTLEIDGAPIEVAAARTARINRAMSGFSGLLKDGAGTLALAAPNFYSKPTVINNGHLLLDFGQTTSPSSNIIFNS